MPAEIDYRGPQTIEPPPQPPLLPRRRLWPHLLLAAGVAIGAAVMMSNRRDDARRLERLREESRLNDLGFREATRTITAEEKRELDLLRQREAERSIERVRRGE